MALLLRLLLLVVLLRGTRAWRGELSAAHEGGSNPPNPHNPPCLISGHPCPPSPPNPRTVNFPINIAAAGAVDQELGGNI